MRRDSVLKDNVVSVSDLAVHVDRDRGVVDPQREQPRHQRLESGTCPPEAHIGLLQLET